MAGNAHANRHGHLKSCETCQKAVRKLNDIVAGLHKYTSGTPSQGTGMKNFVKNCRPLLRQSSDSLLDSKKGNQWINSITMP